jgi:peptide/nickel transport system permease protein
MKWMASAILAAAFLCALLASWVAPAAYDAQFRDSINEPPSARFPLGTDELGRDRFSRLLHGSRVSLLLAPAAALLASGLAALIGGLAGYFGGWTDRIVMRAVDLFLSLPWLFALLTVRALLPLNVSPWISVIITFALLGLLGWAAPARVVRATVRDLMASDFLLQARSYGCTRGRLLLRQVLPALRPVLLAQFWISVPVFILGEANLSLLGLGLAEPLPSLGNLLRGLEHYPSLMLYPWMLAPALVLILVMTCFQLILSREDLPAA